MAERRIDFGRLGMAEYGVGAGFAVVCSIIVSGFAEFANVELPGYVSVAVGAAIGVAAWFSYLLKRNS
jgi:hypothetical protein